MTVVVIYRLSKRHHCPKKQLSDQSSSSITLSDLLTSRKFIQVTSFHQLEGALVSGTACSAQAPSLESLVQHSLPMTNRDGPVGHAVAVDEPQVNETELPPLGAAQGSETSRVFVPSDSAMESLSMGSKAALKVPPVAPNAPRSPSTPHNSDLEHSRARQPELQSSVGSFASGDTSRKLLSTDTAMDMARSTTAKNSFVSLAPPTSLGSGIPSLHSQPSDELARVSIPSDLEPLPPQRSLNPTAPQSVGSVASQSDSQSLEACAARSSSRLSAHPTGATVPVTSDLSSTGSAVATAVGIQPHKLSSTQAQSLHSIPSLDNVDGEGVVGNPPALQSHHVGDSSALNPVLAGSSTEGQMESFDGAESLSSVPVPLGDAVAMAAPPGKTPVRAFHALPESVPSVPGVRHDSNDSNPPGGVSPLGSALVGRAVDSAQGVQLSLIHI